jgi:peptide/nickel transport system substrate-binding protein
MASAQVEIGDGGATMGSDQSTENGRDVVLDVRTRLKKAEMDRRQLILRSLAFGTAAVAGTTAVSLDARTASAQDIPQDELVTMSQEQQQTWIRNFNPLLTEGSVRWPTHCGIYEPLLIFNALTGETHPWLATAWEFSADGLTLTFTIREGVMWSDGTPFTAKDVAFTFQLMQDNGALPGAGGARFVLDDYVTGIESADDTTVSFTFSKAYTPGLWDLGEAMIVPEHIFKDVADPVTFTNETPVGTGPFTEIGTFESQYWELHANPNYWQEGKPYVKGFRFPAYPSNDAANLANTNGENDWFANFIPDIETTFVAKDPEHHHYFQPATGEDVMLYVNTTKAPFDDVNVRKAFSMAIDRAQIVKIAMYDYTHPADATGLSDAYSAWKNADAVAAGEATMTMNVEEANRLLDEAGLTKDGDVRKLADGTEMSYDINVVSGWSDWVQAVQIIAQNFEAIGIKLEVRPYDFAAWFDKVTKGDFDVSIGWSSGGPTPYNFYRGAMSELTYFDIGTVANENWHRYKSAEADALLADFAAATVEATQKDLANQLQMLYIEEFPAIPLFPGPQWGQYNSTRFTDFPNEENPYSILSSYAYTERLLVMTTIKPVAASS